MACPALIDRRPGRNRVTSIVTKNSSNATLHSRTYTFNLASEVTQIVEGTVTTDYTYDNAGQLQSEVKSTGYAASYTYDGNGNRLTRTVNGVTENYSYDAGDKLTAIVGGADPRTFTYDGAGRTTGIVRSSGTTSFTYDYESRVTNISKPGMTTNSMTYNGLDTRVGMTDSSGSRTFKRAGIGVTSPVLSDGSASFTPSGENRAGVKTAYHGGLKSFDTQTNSAQAVVGQSLTDAFGNQISSSGVWKGRFAYGGPYGYQEDPDTGLRLLGHRYYDSSTGRFLTRDPIRDGRNWYAYCDGNPISAVDPNGLAKVYISYRAVQLGHYHALIIVECEETGETWVWEAGPVWGWGDAPSGYDPNIPFGGPTASLSGGVSRRRLTEEEEKNKREIVNDDKSVQRWNSWIGKNTPPNGRPYLTFPGEKSQNGNSNTWVSNLLDRLGYPLDHPQKGLSFPGWGIKPDNWYEREL